jgi:hypothetical protein
LKVDTLTGQGNYDYQNTGVVSVGEVTPWNRYFVSGNDWRNGFYYGELTITNAGADYDQDGDVDGLDCLVWQRNPSVGDLADWHDQYGTPLAAAHTIPEPGTLALAALVLFPLSRRR